MPPVGVRPTPKSRRFADIHPMCNRFKASCAPDRTLKVAPWTRLPPSSPRTTGTSRGETYPRPAPSRSPIVALKGPHRR
jgi:hypothetical protein